MDVDVEEGEDAGLSTVVNVTGAEAHWAISESTGLKLCEAIVDVSLINGDSLGQCPIDVELNHISCFCRLIAASSEHHPHGGGVVIGQVVLIVQSIVTGIYQINGRTAGRVIVFHREGGLRGAEIATIVRCGEGHRFRTRASAPIT